MSAFRHIAKHCGNFSGEVLSGMIAYGRESSKKAGEPASLERGYTTRESDILLGGFLHRQCAQEAARQGRHLAALSIPERQRLALDAAREHLRRHGPVGTEHYRHWMVRVRTFARRRHIVLPAQRGNESDYDYARRLRRWTGERSENWPRLRPAVGTHLVFSPDPKIWAALRQAGVNEREFLRTVLTRTMKEFSDWRRDTRGRGHSLGWMAGTHVEADGANRHPHIHVVVLKRDEAGREADWSVSALKGRRGRGSEPDPMREMKRLFHKNVEKACARSIAQAPEREGRPASLKDRELVRGLRAAAHVLQPFVAGPGRNELSAMLRIAARIGRGNAPAFPTLVQLQARASRFLSRERGAELSR